jgi:hypothetical protein
MSSILETKKALERVFFQHDGVSGVGLSFDETAIVVYVEKLIDEFLEALPQRAADYPIQYVEIGRVNKDVATPTIPFPDIPIPELPFINPDVRKQRWRPVIGGVSVGHFMVSAGTLGSVVIDNDAGNPLFLSNNHVFANSTTLNHHRASRGDLILQPGIADGGGLMDNIGILERWATLDDSIRNKNLIDAALVRPDANIVTMNGVLGERANIVPISGVAPVDNLSVGQSVKVKKFGRTTGYTTGIITDVNFSTVVDYGTGRPIRFVDQILADIQLDGGDSGSLLLDDENRVVGLIFAGSSINGKTHAVANKIRHVLTMLDVHFEGSTVPDDDRRVDLRNVSVPFVSSVMLGVGYGAIVMGLNYLAGVKGAEREDPGL